MKTMRIGAAIAAAAVAGGLISAPVQAQDTTVAITAIVEHPALDAARQGIIDVLAENGYVAGENTEILFESAQGQPATAVQIAQQFVGQAPDVIVPISTPSAQAVVSATQDIPIVFTAVTDPVGAQLVTDMANPGGNVTGISDMSPIADHLALIHEVLPDATTLGVPYNPGEANAVALVAVIEEMAPAMGFTIETAAANRSADVLGAAQSLVGSVDAIYVPTDNTIVSALEAVISVGTDNQIPVFSGDTDSVERGAIGAVGFDYYQIGRQTGEIVVEVLDGADPGSIPGRIASGSDLVVNPAAAEAMGVTIPQSVMDRASRVIE
ncbi:MAG: ABC transporter permease [Alphaproteobacteria bacterium]|jgi:putative ABC transport system substrate-binding protein|nr:ABC transporter permease [Alphaproteobacteria bacterium]